MAVSPLRVGSPQPLQRAMTPGARAFAARTGVGGAQRLRAATRAGGAAATTTAAIAELFDPDTGLPNRLPRNPQEAALFQLQGARAAAGFQRQATRSALATLRFGVGMTQRASPFGLAGALSPLLAQQAQIQAGQQFQAPDFSFFLRPDPFGGGRGGRGLAPIGGIGRRAPSPVGLQFQPEGPGGFAQGFGQVGQQVPVTPIGGQVFGPLQPMLQDLSGVAPQGGGGGSLFDFQQEGGEFEGAGGGGLFGGS